jgi:hypothetical protein
MRRRNKRREKMKMCGSRRKFLRKRHQPNDLLLQATQILRLEYRVRSCYADMLFGEYQRSSEEFKDTRVPMNCNYLGHMQNCRHTNIGNTEPNFRITTPKTRLRCTSRHRFGLRYCPCHRRPPRRILTNSLRYRVYSVRAAHNDNSRHFCH